MRFPVEVDGAPGGVGRIRLHLPGYWTWETIEETDQGKALVEYWVERDDGGNLVVKHGIVGWIE